MLVVGLTGGIASGKSTVSKLLASHGVPIIDADVLAREVIEPGTSGYKLVVNHFGPDRVTLDDGISLNRAAIGDIVFNDSDERKWLNGVIHPRVRKEMVNRAIKYWLKGHWCIVVDVPLLIEAGLWKWVGEVVVVFVNEKLQLSRLLARPSDPPLTPAQASSRIASQLPLSQKLSYATQVIDNSGTQADLTAQIDRLVARWKAQQGGSSGWWWRICWFIPPLGLSAGALCLLQTWWRGSAADKGRRRGRGEMDHRPKVGGGGESYEMADRTRRRQTGSILDGE